MRGVVRWIVVVIVVAHGLLHLLGAAKGLSGAHASQLTQPVSDAMGVAWLATGALVVATAVMLAVSLRWWWSVGAVAIVASQILIITAWSDARAGTVANIVLLLAVVYGYGSHGPRSYRNEFRRRSRTALAEPPHGEIVTETELGVLPQLVAAYIRQSGAVGKPHIENLHARISGRIRSGPTARWMTFCGEQINTFGSTPARVFFIDATMLGLPLDVLHVFVGSSATMRVRAAGLLRIVNAAGTDMDQAETVTVFNDLCVLAPAALVDASIEWQATDADRVRGTFTRGAHTATATLVFNDAHELTDFISDDRLRVSSGQQAIAQRWSTPLHRYRTFGAHRIATVGEGRWHAPQPEGEYTYIEFHVDDIVYNSQQDRTSDSRPGVTLPDADRPNAGAGRARSEARTGPPR